MNYLKNYNTKEIEDETTGKHKKSIKIRIPPKSGIFYCGKEIFYYLCLKSKNMKNIHLLYTDKPSRLGYLTKKGKEVFNDLRLFDRLMPNILDSQNQNLYITSDEEIKIDDYYLGDDNHIYCLVTTVNSNGKKIILTTDQVLIKDGVQAIDDEFLEWFVENPSCVQVEVEIETTSIQLPQQQLSENSYDLAFRWINKKVYKIIIPKGDVNFFQITVNAFEKSMNLNLEYIEEPKQETLEEAIKREYETRKFNSDFPFDPQSFKLGAKWQQERMYSEEEVEKMVRDAYTFGEKEFRYFGAFKEWFEQFKKKQ